MRDIFTLVEKVNSRNSRSWSNAYCVRPTGHHIRVEDRWNGLETFFNFSSVNLKKYVGLPKILNFIN